MVLLGLSRWHERGERGWEFETVAETETVSGYTGLEPSTLPPGMATATAIRMLSVLPPHHCCCLNPKPLLLSCTPC